MIKIIIFCILSFSLVSSAMTLDDFLGSVLVKHHLIQSNNEAQQAASLERQAGDMMLSPQLSLQGGYLDDQKLNVFLPTFFLSENKVWSYSAALSKLFSSGTQAAVNMSLLQSNQTFDSPASNPQFSGFNYATGALAISVSQSLWKGSFGRDIRLRQARDKQIEELNKENFNLQTKQVLIEAESAFWDQLYLQEEHKLRTESLARAKKIEAWVKTRFGNGIGDKADVFNAEGLTASRELQLIQTEDDIKSTQKKISDLLELTESDKLPNLEGSLEHQRDLNSLVVGQAGRGRRIRLDSYLSVLEAKAKAISSEAAADAMKPDLVLSGSYSTNSYEPSTGITGAYNNIYQTNTPTLNVGLKFTWLLDSDLKNASREGARREALASSLKMERQLLESDSAWQEMLRRHQEVSREIDYAKSLAEIQRKRAAAEREKLEKGRTITSQVVTAEQDAAEAALTLTRLEASQRKMESQARMFVNLGEGL